MNNNKEMGVIIDKTEESDLEVFEDALREIDYIQETSETFKFTSIQEKAENVKPVTVTKHSSVDFSKSKLCTTKELSAKNPMSAKIIKTWAN